MDYRPMEDTTFSVQKRIDYKFSLWFDENQYHLEVIEQIEDDDETEIAYLTFDNKDDAYECLEELYTKYTGSEYPY